MLQGFLLYVFCVHCIKNVHFIWLYTVPYMRQHWRICTPCFSIALFLYSAINAQRMPLTLLLPLKWKWLMVQQKLWQHKWSWFIQLQSSELLLHCHHSKHLKWWISSSRVQNWGYWKLKLPTHMMDNWQPKAVCTFSFFNH